jgi:hypothetical protein
MGFRDTSGDVAEGVAYTDGSSASDVLYRIGSESYEVELHEDERDVYAYDRTVYKITIKIEPA